MNKQNVMKTLKDIIGLIEHDSYMIVVETFFGFWYHNK